MVIVIIIQPQLGLTTIAPHSKSLKNVKVELDLLFLIQPETTNNNWCWLPDLPNFDKNCLESNWKMSVFKPIALSKRQSRLTKPEVYQAIRTRTI